MNAAIYPGTFDPITFGHLDIIQRAVKIFSSVIVAVASDTHKKPVFDLNERVTMVKEAVKDIPNVTVEPFNGLITAYARSKGVHTLVRGLRMVSDFEYEFQMALTNRRLADDIETVFLMPSDQYSYLSSTLLKEAAALGASLTPFVPEFIAWRLIERLKK